MKATRFLGRVQKLVPEVTIKTAILALVLPMYDIKNTTKNQPNKTPAKPNNQIQHTKKKGKGKENNMFVNFLVAFSHLLYPDSLDQCDFLLLSPIIQVSHFSKR